MDAESALADLTEISSQVESAVVFEGEGFVLASTFGDEARARQLARTTLDLFAAAEDLRVHDGGRLAQLEVALRDRSVFAVRAERRTIAATVSASAPAGLVLYDLRTCLRAIEESDAAASEPPKRASRKKTTADA